MNSRKISIIKKIRKFFRKIPIKDKCLIMIMSLLIFHLIMNLFSINTLTPEAASIDLIFRMTISSVFGYILSNKFLNFNVLGSIVCVEDEKVIRSCKRRDELNEIKIIITTAIALISIAVLISYRRLSTENIIEITDNHKAIVVQFRDLISGCIGFLIGSDGDSKLEDD